MKLMERIFGKRKTETVKTETGFQSPYTSSGIVVTEDTALKISAVFTCVRIISEAVASLPLNLYQKKSGGRTRAVWRSEHIIVNQQPNPYMDSFVFWEFMVVSLALKGNAYCEKEYVGSLLVALHPINPDRVEVFTDSTGKILYKLDGGKQIFGRETILHIQGFGTDGLTGKSVLRIGAEAMGLAIATEQFGARFFENDASPGVILKHPGELSESAQKRLKTGWDDYHKGVGKSHRTVVLENGVTIEKLTIPPEEAQFLQTRKFQIAEIARLFRVPLHKLNELDKATFSNIEQQSLEFVMDTVRPWLVRIEAALISQLLPYELRGEYYFEWNIDGLLRADIKTRYESYSKGIQWGWMSANEVRAKENLPEIPGGDEYFRPANMIPITEKEPTVE